jgi:hypothetical protein
VEFLGFIPLSPGGEGPWCPLAVILAVAISIGPYPFDILVFITLSGRFFRGSENFGTERQEVENFIHDLVRSNIIGFLLGSLREPRLKSKEASSFSIWALRRRYGYNYT